MKVAESKTASRSHSRSDSQLEHGRGESLSDGQKPLPLPIQTKLTIGKPGDKYEREADAMADYVVDRLSGDRVNGDRGAYENVHNSVDQVSGEGHAGASSGLMRKPIFESDAEGIQAKFVSAVPNIQAKRATYEAEEEQQENAGETEMPEVMLKPIFESDAEEVQAKGVNQPMLNAPLSNSGISTFNHSTEESELSEKESLEEEEPSSMGKLLLAYDTPTDHSIIQRSTEGGDSVDTAQLENRLSSSGNGVPLPEGTRTQMEDSFGADFGGVRIHTNESAKQMNQGLGAQAFTHGKDIYFNDGKYKPDDQEGQKLLAHELTHTIQQGATIRTKPQLSPTSANHVQASFLRDRIAGIVDRKLPVYSLLSAIIGYDLIREVNVDPSRNNILKGVFSLINPLDGRMFELLKKHKIIDSAFDWINAQINDLGLTYDALKKKFDEFWEEKYVVRVSKNIGLIRRKFGPFISKLFTFIGRAKNKVLSLLKEAFLKVLAGIAKKIGGYDLLADLLGFDPLTKEERNSTTADILRGILKLPFIQTLGGDKLLKKLEEHKLVDKAAKWIDQQWTLLKGGFKDLNNIVTKFLNGFTLETLRAPMEFVNSIRGDVVGFVTKIVTFFKNLANKVLDLIKEVSIYLLKTFVNKNTYGFDLVRVILGKDPFTGEKVPRNATTIIKGFLSLLPGGKQIFNKLQETGAIQRAQAWIMGAIQEFIQILGALKLAFIELWHRASIEDLFKPVKFFQRILNLFIGPIQRLVAFVKRVLMKIFEILLQIMKFPVKIARNIISNIQKSFVKIKKDPIGFLLNLLRAVKEGFKLFFDNIGKHLLAGVSGWLLSQVAKAGITPPTDLSFKSILGLVMQILGITVDKLWRLLAKRIGQKKVDKIKGALDRLKGIWQFVKDVVQNGISAVWKYIKEKISNLWNMVIEQVKSWVITKIIDKVVTKLLSMLDPTGIMAVVNGFIAFFNAIKSAVEYFRQMLGIVETFTGGLLEIAGGAIGKAAKFLENALVKALPVALGFMANQVGLGNVGDKLKEIIGKVQGFVESGLNWLIDKALKVGKGILNSLGVGERNNLEKIQEDIKSEEQQYLTSGKIAEEEAEVVAGSVKNKNSNVVKSISVMDGGDSWDYNVIQKKKAARTPKEEKEDPIPPERWLPKSVLEKTNGMRNVLYIKGSGFNKNKIKKRDWPKIKLKMERLADKSLPIGDNRRKKIFKELDSDYKEGIPYAIPKKYKDKESKFKHKEARDLAKSKGADYHVDHWDPLALHWEKEKGWNKKESVRFKIAAGDENLKLIHRSWNSYFGSLGYSFKAAPYVGPNFTSEANDSPKGSLTFGGEPFLDKKGKTYKRKWSAKK